MSEVKRYDSTILIQSPSGGFVDFADYEALRAERDELLRRVTEPIQSWPKYYINGRLYQVEPEGDLTEIESKGVCPACKQLSFIFDSRAAHFICLNPECGTSEKVIRENENVPEMIAEIVKLRKQLAEKDAGWDALKQEVAVYKLNQQVAYNKELELRQQLDELSAQAAVMRDAIKRWRLPPPHTCTEGDEDCERCAWNLALKGTAGRELLERVRRYEEALRDAPHVLCNVAQLLDGWHCDTAWSEYDTDVRKMVSDLQKKLEEVSYAQKSKTE